MFYFDVKLSGFCWGSYMVVKLSANPLFKAGVSIHPSHPKICEQIQENEESLLKDIKCPQLFLSASNDGASVKLGGLGKQVLGDALEIVEFPDMLHGWSIRGDLSDPMVERDVKKAFNLALAFMNKSFINYDSNGSKSNDIALAKYLSIVLSALLPLSIFLR